MDHPVVLIDAIAKEVGLSNLQDVVSQSRGRFHCSVKEREVPLISIESDRDLKRRQSVPPS